MRKEIENGVRWLDYNVPGWEHRIDLETLDMVMPYKCIIGQLGLRDYTVDLKYDIFNGIESDFKFGFSLDVIKLIQLGFVKRNQIWEELNEEWKEVVSSRLNSLEYKYLCCANYTQ